MQKCSGPKSNGINKTLIQEIQGAGMFRIVCRLLNMIYQSSAIALVIQILFVVIEGLLPIAVAVLWKNILSKLEDPAIINIDMLIIPFVLLGVVGGISVSFRYFSEVVDTYFRNQLSLNMQKYIHEKSTRIPVVFYEIPMLKDMIERAQDAFCYGPAVGAAMSITLLISSGISFLSAGILLICFHPLLAFILIIVCIPYLIKIYINKKRVELELKLSPRRREATEYASYFSKYEYVKETKLWDIGSFFLNKWCSIMDQINEEEASVNRRVIVYDFIIEAINRIGYIISIFFSAFFLIQGKIGIGEFGAIIYLLGEVDEKAESFFLVITGLHEELLNVSKGFEYLDLPEDYRDGKRTLPIIDYVESSNVSFVYPLTEQYVLKDINLNIEKNQIVAFVGLNGSGKSTLVKLLLGMLPPTHGKVNYNGTDISTIPYSNLYENVTALFQDFGHYYLNVSENVFLSDISKKDDKKRIKNACINAGCLQWINDLNNGFDTLLGKTYGGQELSGGQWQQLAIARAYFKTSSFVVLDEPTSALDSYNEEILYKNFKALCTDKIGIIVTHRIGAASLADKILVIEDGSIIEAGNHDELILKKGRYWEMYHKQSDLYRKVT